MVRAFGWCNESFDPLFPGRLCRGREKWLDGLPDTPSVMLHRTVMSGAVFSDDSARDAQRGFAFSGIGAGRLLAALFPGNSIWAFCEHGDPRALPPKMFIEEDFPRAISGGLRYHPAVRWVAQAKVDDVDLWSVGERDGRVVPKADGFVVLRGTPSPAVLEGIFLLVGHSDPDDRPARKYNATALPILLDHVAAVVLLHLDKHSPVMGVYTKNPLEADETFRESAKAANVFPVPFAIPPMLARWDRALYELRMGWDVTTFGDFPIPPAEDAGGRWSMRRRAFEEAERRHHQRLSDDEAPPDDGEGEE